MAMFGRVIEGRIAFVILWLLAAGAGFAWISNYQSTSGRSGTTPGHWPAGAQISLDSKADTLVMFAHPRCPCTRASLEELNRLLAQVQGRVTTHVLFFQPGKLSRDWAKTGLWRDAAAIPGVSVAEDIDGAQASLFGAETSGCVLLYDSQGRLLFEGGITGSRGHAGDNAGENALIAQCRGQKSSPSRSPIYGCSLLTKCEAPTTGVAR